MASYCLWLLLAAGTHFSTKFSAKFRLIYIDFGVSVLVKLVLGGLWVLTAPK